MSVFAKLEAQLLLRARLFVTFAAIFVGLAGFTGWQGGQLAHQQTEAIAEAHALEERTDAEALDRAEAIANGEIESPWWLDPRNAQGWSYLMIRHIALPPEALAGVVVSDADLKPFLFRINPHPPDRWSNRASEVTPSVAAYGGLDLVDLILMLTPILVLIAFADVIRDRGGSERQRLAVVQAAAERKLLLRRLAPRASVVLALVAVAALVGILFSRPAAELSVLPGAGLVLLVFLAHALFWIIVTGGLAFFVARPVVTFAATTGLWFVLGVLAPVLVEAGARALSPPPSPLEVFAAERAAVVSARMAEEDLTRAYAEADPLAREMLLAALAEDRLLITPTNLLVQWEVDARRAEGRRAETTRRDHFVERAQQLSSFFPALLARRAIETVAGRDPDRRRAFEDAYEIYHAALQEQFGPYLMRRAQLDHVLVGIRFTFEE